MLYNQLCKYCRNVHEAVRCLKECVCTFFIPHSILNKCIVILQGKTVVVFDILCLLKVLELVCVISISPKKCLPFVVLCNEMSSVG